MIKARGTGQDGRDALVLGLSFKNLDRLRAGDPIEFDGAPYGYPGSVLIFAGRDEAVMASMIERENPGVDKHVEPGAP